LAGVRRVFLKPGEKQKVSFALTGEQLSIIDDRGKRVVEPGEFLVSIGGKQPGFTGRQDAHTTSVIAAQLIVTGKVTEIP
jgi:beta-glucosidase